MTLTALEIGDTCRVSTTGDIVVITSLDKDRRFAVVQREDGAIDQVHYSNLEDCI